MTVRIEPEQKRYFLKKLLMTYEIDHRETVWLLNYLLTDDALLDRIHFVNDVTNCPQSIELATFEMEWLEPFLYRKGRVETTDADRAFHALRLTEEPMYVAIHFPNRQVDSSYAAVEVDNPFAPRSLVTERWNEQTARTMYEDVWKEQTVERVKRLIDEALDRRDFEALHTLQQQLQRLQGGD
ncbi:hypothetical protein GOP80_05480 [Planococcaceae bacterium Storch 2/2-2]|nr:hypothetical protein [Planococcaceae bacterium Storch 2/2-2]